MEFYSTHINICTFENFLNTCECKELERDRFIVTLLISFELLCSGRPRIPATLFGGQWTSQSKRHNLDSNFRGRRGIRWQSSRRSCCRARGPSCARQRRTAGTDSGLFGLGLIKQRPRYPQLHGDVLERDAREARSKKEPHIRSSKLSPYVCSYLTEYDKCTYSMHAIRSNSYIHFQLEAVGFIWTL